MRRFLFAAIAASLAAFGAFGFLTSDIASPVRAAITFNAHVHDDYFHPTGSFVPGPGHVTAQALCMGTTPDPTCTATIQQGDSVQWVAPAPLAANPHTVTECTDGTWTTCGPAVSANNPIADSGVRFQPGWPYVVAFGSPGTFYYRCEIHPTTMRGVVQVQAGVGGNVDLAIAPDSDGGLSTTYAIAAGLLGLAAISGLGLLSYRRLSGRAG